MLAAQPGILADETRLARYLLFSIDSPEDIPQALENLAANTDASSTVVGVGSSLLACLGKSIPGLHSMPAQSAAGIDIPSTPMALWCWLRGTDRGELFHRARAIENLIAPAFMLEDVIDTFQYEQNHDLTGYEDGTENPQGQEAINAAIVQNTGAGLDGSSYVAFQQWLHDFDVFDDMSAEQQDNTIGRHISDNEEFDDAPPSAHVKRAAQESFQPEAFMLRRSMPWSEGDSAGLVFVAFATSLQPYEAILNRMLGHKDGIRDALFDFTRPVNGAYFWCPPVLHGSLDLRALGISSISAAD